jgi:phage FluMu protein Com
VPSVKCPHCGEINEFPGFDAVDVFVCFHCDELVEIGESKE